MTSVREGTTWTPDQAGESAAWWDRMAAGRGTQADIYCSHAWFRAWLENRAEDPAHVAIPTVLEDGLPVALLPLVRRRGQWVSTNAGVAPRFRPTLRDQAPDPDVLAQLVEQTGRTGVRELELHGLPTRDPATELLLAALRADGYLLDVEQRSADNVACVTGNDDYARALRKLESSSRSRARRIQPYWEMTVERFGGEERPLAEGVELFEVVQARSWKGPHRESAARQRLDFLTRADRQGWVRLLILSIAGRPAAGNIWFRLGEVAVGWSTAYDQRLAVLAPGQILHQEVQRAVYEAGTVLMDMLPGESPFKDAFRVERPPLLTVRAHRRTAVRGAGLPARRLARRAVPALGRRLEEAVRRGRDSMPHRAVRPSGGRRRRVPPLPGPSPVDAVVELAPEPPLRRYLALVARVPSAEAVAAAWSDDDRWLLVTDGGLALVRLSCEGSGEGPAGTVHEVVRLEEDTEVTKVAGVVARHLGGPVDVLVPPAGGLERESPLPWHASLAVPVAATGR